MKYYLITDTHFNHVDKMVKYCGRPENYESLILKHLGQLPEDAVLIHLGDVAMGYAEAQAYANKETLWNCGCKQKWLLRGNHDQKSNGWYLSKGWHFVATEILLEVYGKKILFSHHPADHNKLESVDINIHGHYHNSDHHLHEFEHHPKHKLLAIEYTNYRPVNLQKFLAQ